MTERTLGFIGAGNMNTAILNGGLGQGSVRPEQVWLSNRHADKLSAFAAQGVHTTTDNREVAAHADLLVILSDIEGLYTADPRKDPNAVKYSKITYDEVLAQHLEVMDTTATSLSMDNKIPVLLFALKDPENILRAVMGEEIGTIVGG